MRCNFNLDGTIVLTAASEDEKAMLKSFCKKFQRGPKLMLAYNELTNSADLSYIYFINRSNLLKNGFTYLGNYYYGKFELIENAPNYQIKVRVYEAGISGYYQTTLGICTPFQIGNTIDSLNAAIKSLIDSGILTIGHVAF